MTENGGAAAAAAAVADAPAELDPSAAAAAVDPAAEAAAAAPDPAAAAAAPVDASKPAAAQQQDENGNSQPQAAAAAAAAAAPVHPAAAAAAAAAAATGRPQPPSLEQCKVLQTVIKLLEHHEDAGKMLPLAAMSAETLQLTLAHSPQPINVADVLSKLMPHLEPAVADNLWEQFRRGSNSGSAAANGAAAVAAAATSATAAAILSQAAPLAPGAANPAHAKLRRQAYAANNAKCAVCAETYHPSFSPLLLCDFCPQAYHVYCLGLDWPDLPEGDWACPSCLPLPSGQRSVMQQQRLLAMQSEQQMRLKAFAAGAAADKERRKAEEKAAKDKQKEEQKKADSKRAKGTFQVDDMDLAMEEAAEAARLSSLLPQLQDAAEREGGGRRGSAAAAAAAAMGAYEPMDDAGDSEHGLPPLPPNRRIGGYGAYGGGGGGYMGAQSASDQFREASDKLRRLQATAAGPPTLKDTITDERQLHSLMDALAVAEFLATFAAVCGAPLLNLAQLQQAVAWPLDGPELFETYSSLVKYLLAQWSHIESGHVGARVRRWARCLERSSAIGSFDAAASCEGVNGSVPNGNATWQELLRRYCLLSRSSLRVKDSELKPGQQYASMSDDLIMVHAAVELGKQDAWRLPPEFHLRLLHALCNDVVNCFNMKAEISSRLDTSIALQIEKFHADAEERKKEKEAARMRREAAQAARDKRARELSMASTPAEGGTPDPQFANSGGDGGAADGDSTAEPPLKRARSSSGAMDAMGGGEGTPGLGGDTRDGTPDPAAAAAGIVDGQMGRVAGWRSGEDREARDAALSAELARYMIRSEPLGMDRHHQRYWHMQSLPSIIFVESAEGDSLGLITCRAQLDALMASLNKRGTRESVLHQVLHKRYAEFCRCLRPPNMPLDVAAVPRNRRARRNWLKQAAKAMPANIALDASGWPVQQQQQKQDKEALPDYQELLAASESTAVAAALSELEGLVSQLVGVGIYDLAVKEWRQRLRGKTTVDELCQMLEEFEAALSRVGDGRPAGATEEAIDEFIREADIYEAEFVMPVSAAELAEQQEAAAAAAAAAAAEKAAAAAADGGDGMADDGDACEPPALAAAAAAARPPPPSNKKGKKAAASSSKKSKGSGGSKAGGSSKKGGKKGSTAASAADGDADDDTNPDAAAHRGPMVTLFSGATRVRKAGHVKPEQQQQQVKQEAEDSDAMQVDGSAVVKSEQEDAAAAAADGAAAGASAAAVKAEQDEDLTKMVSPLEELDDSDVEAEKRYQEKRAAEKAGEPLPPPPVVLWRSARELGVWVKDLRRARTTGALGGAAYAAAALVDRAHRLMSNLALSRIRTGIAAAIAEDRQCSVRRKLELLLGPTPWEEALGILPGMLDNSAADKAAQKDNTIVTSTGRRIKGTSALQEPRRKMSARQRSKRGGGSAAGSDDEAYYAAYGDEYGDYYGGYEAEPEEAYPMPEGKWGLECCVCGGSGPEVACCEVPGCSVLMHLGCAGMPDADFYYCPDHIMTLQQPWLHAVGPPDKYPQPHAPPVKPNAT